MPGEGRHLPLPRLRILTAPVARTLAAVVVATVLSALPVPGRAQDDVNPRSSVPQSPAVPVDPSRVETNRTAAIYNPPRVVPDVVGRSQAYATRLLERSGLVARPGGERDARQQSGIVLETRPSAGKQVRAGSTVIYWVASGMNLVPDVRGDPLRQAASQLGAEEFRLGARSEEYARTRPGLVIAQTPTAGTRARLGTPVALVVSRHPQVPKLVGLQEPAAIKSLRAVTLLPQRVDAEPSAQLQGTVLRSDPVAGTGVAPGSRVRYWLASGDNLVPDVLQQPRDRALRMIEAESFDAGTISERADLGAPGRVIAQTPAARTRAPLDSPVSLVLSRAVLMPDIVGHPETEALAMLEQVGLDASKSGMQASLQPRDLVLTSTPAAGTRVAADTPVNYTTASGENRVPDLDGTTPERARRLITDAGFQPGQFTSRPAADRIGLVLGQAPAEGTLAPLGSAVSAVVGNKYPTVPDVTGQAEATAVAQLEGVGFNARRTGVEPSPQPKGRVLRTQPVAGDMAAPGSEVGYWLASGDNTVPDLAGNSRADAQQLAETSGFRLAEPSHRYAPESLDLVIGQTPLAGAVAPLGSGIAPVVGTDQLRIPETPAANSIAKPGDTASLQLARPWLALVLGSASTLAIVISGWWTLLKPWPAKLPVDIGSSLTVEPPSPPEGLAGSRDPDVTLRVDLEPGPPPDVPIPIIDKETHDE